MADLQPGLGDTITPITKGWSADQKYCLTKADGTKYLLRVSPTAKNEKTKNLFDILLQAAQLDIPMCMPVDLSTTPDGIHTLYTWINGQDVQDVIPLLSETRQYLLGMQSGQILKRIHTLPAPASLEDWAIRFNRKIDAKIRMYHDSPLRFQGDDAILRYIKENRCLLVDRPQCFQHGDYHIGNMMLEGDRLIVIDFDRFDFGDPWEEFNRIVWSAQASPHFASGQLNGYFGGRPPMLFFRLLALYIASNMLSSIPWAVAFGQNDVDVMMRQAQDVLAWFDGMRNPVPTWYIDSFYFQYTDGVPYKLKAPYDFSFLQSYGTVFTVFDDQDSGNICFGLKNGEDRYFIKFAGAPTARYDGTPQDAVARLKATVPLYMRLRHPRLIPFIRAEETGGGFALVFGWVDGICMGRMYPQCHRAFMDLPLQTKQRVLGDILDFHDYVARQGYVAIDFYDGSVMYDFEKEQTMICDIDFYAPSPYQNTAGRMWGSARFMSPEECIRGALIDEISNVYTMGATAFALFADSDRTPESWPLSAALYDVAAKACSAARDERQKNIRQFIDEWQTACLV